MQKVSKAYRQSMKGLLRNRSYMIVTLGVLDYEAQQYATITEGDFAYFSNQAIVQQRTLTTVYATLEKDFTPVDSSMRFPPRRGGDYIDTGITSRGVVTDSGYVLDISLNIKATSMKGLTINFGDVYPVDFDVVTSKGEVTQFRDNDTGSWVTEETFDKTTSLRFVFYKMSKPETRLRISSIMFGYGLFYTNSDIVSSTLESYVSPISADIPQIDFSVKLINYDQYFNLDNPKSVINYLETDQQMVVYYGYDLDDTTEWLKGGTLYCSSWESNASSATIKCTDRLRTLDSEYYKGLYRSEGISLYDLAILVFEDAGVDEADYYIDVYLKKIKSKNPLPRVEHREALQIIANAGRCTLSQDRDGIIRIKSSFMPEWYTTSNSEQNYSKVANIKKNNDKAHFASYAYNYNAVDSDGIFIKKGETDFSNMNTGYVSKAQSKADGTFDVNPVITVVQEAACTYYGMKIEFGDALPSEFILHLYNSGEETETLTVNDDIFKTTIISDVLEDFDTMEIEFTKTAEPYSYIVVDYLNFGDIADFTMEKMDMLSDPTTIKQELVRNIEVIYYAYNPSTEEELVNESMTVAEGETATFYFDDAVYGLTATFDDLAVEIAESGSYYCKVIFTTTGTGQLTIKGRRYSIATQKAICTLNERGKTVVWENPLMSDSETSMELAEWLGGYYNAGAEYKYNTRGNPEIDANDIIYQENDFNDSLKVNVYKHTVKFSQALSGSVVTRRHIDTATEEGQNGVDNA
jgi:hypothetical protein